MKKLLTILVSAASACFAFADEDGFISGTSFESLTVNTALDKTKDDIGTDTKLYWHTVAASDYGLITNYDVKSATSPIANRPAKYASADNEKYLLLDTSDTLYRTIDGITEKTTVEGEAQVTTTTMNTVDIGQGIYFDSLVKFTATEDNVTPSEGDKLVVWLKAVEAEMNGEEVVKDATTNLIITAGIEDSDTHKISAVDYVIQNINIEEIDPNGWCRLTIKSFTEGEGDNKVPYFNVYVNGTLAEASDNTSKFLSLVDYTDKNYLNLSAVGFKGTGAVDDLAFTTDNPLVQTFPLSVAVPNECTVISCWVGGTEINSAEDGTYLVDVTATDVKVSVEVPSSLNVTNANAVPGEIAEGMQTWVVPVSIKGATANTPVSFTVTVEAKEVPAAKPFSVTVAGVPTAFATLADAIAKATAGATIVVAKDANENPTSYEIEGLMIDKSIIIDLNGNTLVLNKPAVGATDATKTLGIRIEGPDKSLINVTIMNGEIEISEDNLTKEDETDKQIKMMINNYANLTLTDVTLDGTNLVDPANDQPKYVLSNNRGNVLLDGSTSIIVPTTGTKGSVAFDVCKFQDYNVPTVTLKLDEGYTIGGDVEVTGGNFVYEAGEISGAIKFSSGTIKGVAKEDITVVPGDKVLGTNTDGAWILVDKPADPEPEEPTIGDTEVKFDETGVITNITTAANNKDVSGVADINAFLAKFEGCYTVSVENGKLNIALNDNAKPVIGEADIDSDETEEPAIQIVDGQFKVTIQDSFKSLKYKLQYKAGLGNNPETGKPYDWTEVATDEVGTKGGAMQLSAPADGPKGFYRVVVTE